MQKGCQIGSLFTRRLSGRKREASINAGTMYAAHAAPKIAPVRNREKCVFAQISKNPNSQSIVIGAIAAKSQKRRNGSVSSIRRRKG
jgi:hypothetical protein